VMRLVDLRVEGDTVLIIQSKEVLSMYIGLKVQTNDTITAGQQEILEFSSLMEVGAC
jgi:hypothetical protein